MSHDQVVGITGWLVLLTWAVVGWLYRRRLAGATPSTVSGNNKTGPKWEQDAPFPECFEDTRIEDDL